MKKTFRIGGIHPDDSKLAAGSAIGQMPLCPEMRISMAQHLGAPATPVVAVGDKVKVGQVIGEPSGFISGFVHSSVSGTVKSVGPMPDIAGNPVPHVVITVEGDEWDESIDRTDTVGAIPAVSAAEIVEKVRTCGIVGLGGASFPTHVKLNPPKDKKAEVLIINGTECEPYITSDDRLMRERPDQVVRGAALIMKALGVSNCYIGIEENKKEAVRCLRESARNHIGISVVELAKKYPQGGEKQLIDSIIRRQVPSGALPIDVGAVVQNVATAYAVYEAVCKNKPLISNIVTVSGRSLASQHNLEVRIGTPISAILEYAGVTLEDGVKVISGGPMMGKAVANLNATTVKANGAFTILSGKETLRVAESPCIRCGKCAQACPMGLEPWLLSRLFRAGDRNAELEQERVFDCIECGCCQYTCPAGIPLLDSIRLGKADVMRIIRSRSKK